MRTRGLGWTFDDFLAFGWEWSGVCHVTCGFRRWESSETLLSWLSWHHDGGKYQFNVFGWSQTPDVSRVLDTTVVVIRLISGVTAGFFESAEEDFSCYSWQEPIGSSSLSSFYKLILIRFRVLWRLSPSSLQFNRWILPLQHHLRPASALWISDTTSNSRRHWPGQRATRRILSVCSWGRWLQRTIPRLGGSQTIASAERHTPLNLFGCGRLWHVKDCVLAKLPLWSWLIFF